MTTDTGEGKKETPKRKTPNKFGQGQDKKGGF
jgi:hypothetical protein